MRFSAQATIERPLAGAGGASAAPKRGMPELGRHSLEASLQHATARLCARFPDCDRGVIQQLVNTTSARLLARAKLAEFVPLLTERHVREVLDARQAECQHDALAS